MLDPHGHYSVQVGSYKDSKDAYAYKERLLDMDLPAYIAESDLSKKGSWYMVRIGPYLNAEAAEQVYRSLKDKGYSGFVKKH